MQVFKQAIYKVYGNPQWCNLVNMTVRHENVLLEELGDIHPHIDHPIFNAKKLFILACDKNWLYYHLNLSTFPHVEELYLHSHPDDQIKRLISDFPKVSVTDHWSRSVRVHNHVTNPDNSKLSIITKEDFFEAMKKIENSYVKVDVGSVPPLDSNCKNRVFI